MEFFLESKLLEFHVQSSLLLRVSSSATTLFGTEYCSGYQGYKNEQGQHLWL